MTTLIGYANVGEKVHANVSCGVRSHYNAPYLAPEGEELDRYCKRCGGPAEVATPETITKAFLRYGKYNLNLRNDPEAVAKLTSELISKLEGAK